MNERGVLVVTWYDRREDDGNVLTNYYLATSDDGGATFGPNRAVSSEASDFAVIGSANNNFGIGEYTQVVATSGYAIPFWADGRTNDGNIEIFSAFLELEGGVTTSAPRIGAVSDRFSLQGPFPNPARESAQIVLTLKEKSEVHLDLFSANGQLIRSIPLGERAAGIHPVTLPLTQLNAGAYVLRTATRFGWRTAPLLVTGK